MEEDRYSNRIIKGGEPRLLYFMSLHNQNNTTFLGVGGNINARLLRNRYITGGKYIEFEFTGNWRCLYMDYFNYVPIKSGRILLFFGGAGDDMQIVPTDICNVESGKIDGYVKGRKFVIKQGSTSGFGFLLFDYAQYPTVTIYDEYDVSNMTHVEI